MKLSANHLSFMINFVYYVIRPLVSGSGRLQVTDSVMITMISLYMMHDSEALTAMQAELGARNPRVAEIWNNLYDSVVLRNRSQVEREKVDINEIIRKLK